GYFSVVYQPARDAHGAVEGILVHAVEVTDQARARQYLRHEETAASRRATELEAILDAIADGVVIYDDAGRLLQWNTALAEMFELERMPEYVELPVDVRPGRLQVRDERDQPIPPDQLPFMRAVRGEMLTGAQAVDLTITTPSGRVKNVNASAAPLHDETGHTIGAVTVYRDVTERRQSEERLRAILELLPVGVAFVDANGKAVLVNQAVKAIWGDALVIAESRDDYGAYKARWSATGKPVAPDEWGLARALATGEVSIGEEFEIETTDGSRKSILGSNAPLRDTTGAIIGGISVIVDISERKRLERHTHDVLEALLAMAEMLALLPEDGADAAAETPPYPVIRRMVTLAQRVLGVAHASVVVVDRETGVMQPLAVSGPTAEREDRWWAEVGGVRLERYLAPADAARLYQGEIALIADSSDEVDHPASASPHVFEVKPAMAVPAPLGREMVVLSVDARNRPPFTPQERDLARAAARLAALVFDRDRLQHEREVALTRELALAEANRRMDEFLGIASHELRTPLTSVQGNIQLIGRRLARLTPTASADPVATVDELRAQLAPLAPLVERTERQMRRLTRLISELLDVTRIRGGQLEFLQESCDLVAIIREAVEEQRMAWPTRVIAAGLPELPITVVADADRIGQVVTNYLTNALKYSPPDQTVIIQARVEDGAARVVVYDSGPGLTPEQQAHLFERFYRAPGIQQQSGSGIGLGLGLSICRTIIERHGGATGVESAAGAGSAFWFTLPLAHPPEGAGNPGTTAG
ncbi:MAG TPA: ATP-binding protein, partial [Ktedonobacterales bacterium]